MKKEERRAYDKAIADYTEQLSALKPLDQSGSIKPTAYRTATETVGDNLSAADRRNLRKSDSLARKINNDDVYKSGIARYNDRLTTLQNQMQGQTADRFFVSDTFIPPKASGSAAQSGPSYMSMGGLINETPSPMSMTSTTPKAEYVSDAPSRQYFGSESEALAAAAKKAQDYNAKNPTGLIGLNRPATAADFMGTQRFESALEGGRTARFGKLDNAAKDLQALSETIRGSAGEAAASQYTALAEKLNARLNKIGNQPQAQVGLLGAPLAGELDTGVITS